ADALKTRAHGARDYLVTSQGAWSCQRAVRFDDWICIKSYHGGYHGFPDVMLFDLKNDPHEQSDVAASNPQIVRRAMTMLEEWEEQMMSRAIQKVDPMQTVLSEGGAFHTRGQLPGYLKRLRETGRTGWAELLAARHPSEC